ncbi:exopolysaccharide biosynthesis protein [Ostreiculturibacter nitratireducens]|uniref:exopolysaccharide biosynthesis protein n=1 Tax=Ostreiculturibacter nitratireducens TaxID=3075226 RepID=UPI0031B5FF4F
MIVSPLDAPSPEPSFETAGTEESSVFTHPKPLSAVLMEAATQPGERITLGELVASLSSRGFAPLILLMGILNVVTIIPGSSTVMGLPLVFMGIAVILNSRRLWLPSRLSEKSFDRALLLRAVLKARPWLERIERLARPRFWPKGGWILDRAYGIIVLCFALMITLPIAFGNTMPAISIILLSLGFAARDGLWVAGGLVAGSVAVGILMGLAAAVAFAGTSLLGG